MDYIRLRSRYTRTPPPITSIWGGPSGSRQLDEAIACYRRALELQPQFVEAHFNLGNALIEQGQIAEAMACFRRAVQLNPDYAECIATWAMPAWDK